MIKYNKKICVFMINSPIEALLLRDHQIYFPERLKPTGLQLNAKLPSIFDILVSPYVIIKNGIDLSKKKIEGRFSHINNKTEITKHSFHLLISAMNILQYLGWFGVLALETTFLSTPILALTLGASLLGACKSAYLLAKQQLFIFSLKSGPVELVRKAKSNPDLLKSLTQYVPENLQKEYEEAKNASEKQEGFLEKLELELIKKRLSSIDAKFLSLSDEEKIKYKQAEFTHEIASEIQNKYVAKKRDLASYIHHSLSADISNKIKGSVEQLEDKTAIELYNQITSNAYLKRKILFTSFMLYCINIAFSALSLSIKVPLPVTISVVAITSIISFINHLEIFGRFEQKEGKFNFINCLPAWIGYIHEKISGTASSTKTFKATPSNA